MEKRENQKRTDSCRWKKSAIFLVSLMLILSAAVGGTLAYLITKTDPVSNTFNPTEVTSWVDEDTKDGIKSNVTIKNTGDVSAYIRAAVVITWRDEDGNVYGQVPVACETPGCDHESESCNADYLITYFDGNSGWVQRDSDGFYYYIQPVEAGDSTEALIESCEALRELVIGEGDDQVTYRLSVEIIGSAVQAEGADSKGNKPIELAWGVDIENGELKDADITE